MDISNEQNAKTWDTTQLINDFKVLSFSAPYVVVIRISDNAKGTLEFTHYPRVYYNFIKD